MIAMENTKRQLLPKFTYFLYEQNFNYFFNLGSPNPPAEMKLTPPSSPHVGSGHNVFSTDGSQPQSGAKER